jgi:hypothetical protein
MKKLLFIASFYLLFACSNQEHREESQNQPLIINIENNLNNKVKLEGLFDSIQFIKLENSSMIGNIRILEKLDDSTYILADTEYEKTIYLASTNGQIINQYKYEGVGPGEANYLRAIKYDSNNSQFIALMNTPNKLLFFDKQLNFKSYNMLRSRFDRFYFWNSTLLLYEHDNLTLYKKNSNTQKEKFIFEVEYEPFYPVPVFYNSESGLLINSPKDPFVYKLDKDTLYTLYEIKYNYNKSRDGDSPLPQFPPTITLITETNNHLILFYSYKYFSRILLFSTKKQKVIENGFELDVFSLMDRIHFAEKSTLYGTMSADKFVEMIDTYENKGDTTDYPKLILPTDYKKTKVLDNPFIVKYYLK